MEWLTESNPEAQLPVPRRKLLTPSQWSELHLKPADRFFLGTLSLALLIAAGGVLALMGWFLSIYFGLIPSP